MRPELELIEKIEDFLKGRLSADEMAAFRKQIAADPELREKVQLQEDVMKGLERASLVQKVKLAGKGFHFGKAMKKWGWGLAATAVVVTSTVLLFNYWKGENHKRYEGSLSLYNESGKKEFADADRKIASQVFSIDGSKDTVIETKAGITFSIPANGFLDENGKPVTGAITVSVKEALDAATIMTSGLSTQSGGRLLETGGMFYIDARTSDHILKIDPVKGIYAGVPADTIKPGMQLFQGKRMADGSIDWVDPKPISHDLTTVDIKSLNFYPPFYLDSLKSWGYDISNKKFTDSLYYSFASLFNNSPKPDSSIEKTDTNGGHLDSIGKIDGKAIFQSKCASCHAIERDMTGPKMEGVIGRWGGNMHQIRVWVKNWARAVAAGYPRAVVVEKFSGSAMTQFEDAISDAEIDAVIQYADGVNGPKYDDVRACGINPAMIKTIWSEEFQNTFIATPEFRERLALIHEIKNPALLDLYVTNLDKNLFELDSMAARLLGVGEPNRAHEKFLVFAARRDGNVRNNTTQFQKLCEFYQKKTRAYTEAIAKTEKKFWDKQRELDDKFVQKSSKHWADSFKRVTQNFQEEFETNLKDVKRQLGYDTTTKFIQVSTQPVYNVVVTNTGWNNVDKYVFDATEQRKDMSYTDPQTGKTATLTYTPLEVNIVNASQYDQVYVYLLPDKLSSFMRMNGSAGRFSEKLNGIMTYDLVCIGYKGEIPFFYSQKAINPGTYNFELKQTNQRQLDRELKRSGPGSQTKEIKKELEFLKYEIKDKLRQQRNESIYQLWHRIEPNITCMEGANEYIGPESVPVTDSARAVINSPKP